RLGTAAKAVAGIDSYVKEPAAKGSLLGCWAREIGELNRLIVLRAFADANELATERARTLGTTNPFHCGEALSNLRL
ncbi:NIPSNAP family protein, partial [Acinetobacter baumannii]